ncbi:MAG: hypothetical protein D6705_04170 [Deltaproteobacteria bacterium]|nr:MAG: hypothetical protein D6705_04170 [Deltaproteobacteria bacterium]
MHRGILAFATLVAASLVPGAVSAKRVVYINTDPVTLVDTAGQDPTMNSYSSNGFSPGPISGWPALTDDQKQELLWLMKEAAVPFDLEFVLERPAQGTYDMLVFGTSADQDALFPNVAGCSTAIGLADCNDGNAENISFLFYGCMSAGDQMDMRKVAFNGFTALGFSWGLEQLQTSGQIMGSYTFNGLHFGDSCIQIQGSSQCSHVACAAGQQNSTADLLDRIGARVDDGPPTVTITAPEDGAMVGSDFTVTADVFDAFGGLEVALTIVEANVTDVDDNDPQWVYEWPLTGVPDGLWTLEVSATDADGNVTTDQIQVCVGNGPCEPGGSTGGGSTGGGSTGGGSTGGSGTGGDTTGGMASTSSTTSPPPPTTAGGGLLDDDAEVGCGCTHGGSPPAGGALLVWAVAAVARRRPTRP